MQLPHQRNSPNFLETSQSNPQTEKKLLLPTREKISTQQSRLGIPPEAFICRWWKTNISQIATTLSGKTKNARPEGSSHPVAQNCETQSWPKQFLPLSFPSAWQLVRWSKINCTSNSVHSSLIIPDLRRKSSRRLSAILALTQHTMLRFSEASSFVVLGLVHKA